MADDERRRFDDRRPGRPRREPWRGGGERRPDDRGQWSRGSPGPRGGYRPPGPGRGRAAPGQRHPGSRRDFQRPPWEAGPERRPDTRDEGPAPHGPRPPGGRDENRRSPGSGRGRGFADRPGDRYGERPPGARPETRHRRPVTPREGLLSAGEELVAGRRPVEEAYAARREALRLLVVPERRPALEALVLHATTLRIPIVEVEGGTLTSLAGFDGHQGVALVVPARVSATVDDLLRRARERSEPPFVLVLDSLEDPQNLGTLLRSAEACGVHGVIFPTRRSAPLTPAAIKASAGATEHLLLAPVDDLASTLVDLRSRELRLVGADEGAPLRYSEADLRGPLALVVGSEERGISGALRRRLDLSVRIPMRGRVGSLNAAVAGSVLLFAAADQRGSPEAGDQPAESREEPPAVVGEPSAIEPSATDPSAMEPPADELLPGEPPPSTELRPGRRSRRDADCP